MLSPNDRVVDTKTHVIDDKLKNFSNKILLQWEAAWLYDRKTFS